MPKTKQGDKAEGIIADGRPHLPAVVSKGFKQNYSGRLEESCEVLYLAEILLVPFENKKLVRRINPDLGVAILQEAEAMSLSMSKPRWE